MSHERLKHMKEILMCAVEGQLCNLSEANPRELGDAIDMIKDLEETMYYCTIIEAMEEQEEEGKMYMGGNKYFREKYPTHEWQEPYYRDMDRENGRMYYPDNGNGKWRKEAHSTEKEYPFDLRDHREGRSPHSRKMYMVSKEAHKDKASQLRELEKYMQELTADIVEMIEDASAEEKQYLEKKITSLAQKISQLNG